MTRRRLRAVVAPLVLLIAGVWLGACGVPDAEVGPATAPANPTGPCTVVTGSSDDFPGADGTARIVESWVPADADSQTPLVVALHSAESTGPEFAELTGLSSLARGDDTIVVYPSKDTQPSTWDVSPGGVDVAFIADLIDYLHAHGCGSPANTSVMGYSAGAMLTSRLMCVRPEGFSTAMVVGGVLPPTWGCEVPPDMAIVAVHATGDSFVRYDGQVLPLVSELTGQSGFTTTRAEMVRQWSLAKGCPGPPDQQVDEAVTITRYDCPPAAPTTLLTYTGGDHGWRLSTNWDTSAFLWSQRAGA